MLNIFFPPIQDNLYQERASVKGKRIERIMNFGLIHRIARGKIGFIRGKRLWMNAIWELALALAKGSFARGGNSGGMRDRAKRCRYPHNRVTGAKNCATPPPTQKFWRCAPPQKHKTTGDTFRRHAVCNARALCPYVCGAISQARIGRWSLARPILPRAAPAAFTAFRKTPLRLCISAKRMPAFWRTNVRHFSTIF